MSTEVGNAWGEGLSGSNPEKTGAKLTPAMMASTRARKPGGRGATLSSARSTAERWMALESCGLGNRARLSPRNQDTESTASAEKMAPATLSIRPLCGCANSRRRMGSPTQ